MSPARILRRIVFCAPLLAAPGANCALDAPPADAGVDLHMGVLLKVYPRTPDIGPGYHGCQTLWARADEGWETLGIAHYANGRVVRIENPALPNDPVEQCLVRDGAVLRGDPELCTQLDDMRFESLPADCLDAAAGAIKADARCVRR